MAERALSMTWVKRMIATPDWNDLDPRYPERSRSYLDRNALKARRP
jgi:hypothetical protein